MAYRNHRYVNIPLDVTVLCAVEEVIIVLVRLYQKYSFELDDKLLKGPLEFGPGRLASPKALPVTIKLR